MCRADADVQPVGQLTDVQFRFVRRKRFQQFQRVAKGRIALFELYDNPLRFSVKHETV